MRPLSDALLARTALRTLHPGGGGEGPGHVHLRGQERGGQVSRRRLPPGQQCYQHEDLKVSRDTSSFLGIWSTF